MGVSDNPARTGPTREINGIFVLDKPVGISSMKAVAIVRRRAGGVKTGHAGTLDPLAEGVLVLALGRATKLIERLMDTSKRYRTTIDLSAFTATDDAEAEPDSVEVKSPPGRAEIDAALDSFRGRFMQRPPDYSAVKVGGQRAYRIARKAKAGADKPALKPRPVEVMSLAIAGYDWPLLDLDIHCAKGFYVRRLARDLGTAMGTGGYCRRIRRTAVGPFDESLAIRLNDLPEVIEQEMLISQQQALDMIVE